MFGFVCVTLFLLFLCHLGSAIFTTNPTNVTTCPGSPAVFICVINENIVIGWLINGQSLSSQPPSTLLTPGPGAQSTLTLSGTSQLNGASVQCYYLPSGSLIITTDPPAYLSVQAPPAAPTNLTNTPINATSTILAWGPPPVQSPSLLSYVVEVSNGSGVLVYRGTVTVPQVTITTPDPCDQYKATVSAQYMIPNLTCTGNSSSSKSLGAPPSVTQPTTSLMFPMSPQDNVTVNISLPYQSAGVCYYKTMAVSGSGVYSFPSVKPLPQNGGQVNITSSLPPNKHFTLIITASNGYGSTSSSVAISTFGVIGISANTSSPSGLVCLFNPGSLATGCLVYLTDTTTGVTYCRVVGKSLDTPVNISLCPFSPSNGPLGTGMYSVVVYVIESDGSVSSVPAINGERLSVFGPSTVSPEPSSTPNTPNTSSSTGAIIGGAIGGGIGGGVVVIGVLIAGGIVAYCLIKKKKKEINLQVNVPAQPNEHQKETLELQPADTKAVYAQVTKRRANEANQDDGQNAQSANQKGPSGKPLKSKEFLVNYTDVLHVNVPYKAPGEENSTVQATAVENPNGVDSYQGLDADGVKPKEQLELLTKEGHPLAAPSRVDDQELNVFGKAIEVLPVIKQLSEIGKQVDGTARKFNGEQMCSISPTELNEIRNQLHDIASKLGEMNTRIRLEVQQSVMNVIKKHNNNPVSDPLHIERLDGTNQQMHKASSDT